MSGYNFKRITTIPDAKQLVDIVLTRTQRQTPTVVHKGYKIGILRKFYMRKVKFTQQTINDKLQLMLTDFPVLDDIHPFYADLFNVLYDKDHYKLALGQINNARRLVDNISSDYLRLLKYGDSLYRCKQLKRAALGRMVKVLLRLDPSLTYLEQVRQHLARLPSIDPNTRTLLICGFPNVGKSSFMNKITRANVDVQPYAFTTKSLFVGHTDYRFLRWQIIDTPGVLDHPLEDRNTIEMQSITALAHLNCSVLFFLDISQLCGYSIEQQVGLFESIAPLFQKKPLVVVLSKIDVRSLETLSADENASIAKISEQFKGVKIIPASPLTGEGISDVKETACEMLLQVRAESKLRGIRRDQLINKFHVSVPVPRDDVSRPACLPQPRSDVSVVQENQDDFERQKQLYFDMDLEYAGVDWRKRYTLENDDWRNDIIPEILDGENVLDFMDPALEKNLSLLETEEEEMLRVLADERVEQDENMLSPEEIQKLNLIRRKKAILISQHRAKKSKNYSVLPIKNRTRTVQQLQSRLSSIGIDPSSLVKHVEKQSKVSNAFRRRLLTAGVDKLKTRLSISNADSKWDLVHMNRLHRRIPRLSSGSISLKQLALVNRLDKNFQRKLQRTEYPGPAHGRIVNKKPKHLFSGKRKLGKADRR